MIDDRISRYGGVQEYVLGLYDFLKTKGHQPIIFTSGRYSQKQKQERKIVSFAKTFELGTKKGISLSLGQGEKIKRILKKEKPEVVHLQGMPGPLGLNFLRHSPGVNIMTFHVAHEGLLIELLAKSFAPLWKEMEKYLHGKIAISKVAADYAQKFCSGPYKIIPIGIDFERFGLGIPKIKKFADGKINILFVGRLDKRKGIEYLLKAYQRLNQQIPKTRLLIVGDGPQRKRAYDYVKKEKLKNVVFARVVSRQNLPFWYATADIFCSPATHGESFGVVLLEAMASGLPIVAFDNPGYQSLFPNFARSFLIPNKNISALTQALLILATNKNLRQELGRRNRCYVQRYSWEKVGNQILKFYQRLLRQSPAQAQPSLIIRRWEGTHFS